MKKFLSLFAALLFLGVTQMWGENLTRTEGFETKAVGTNYQSTVTVSEAESDCEIGWSIYYGTVSTNDKISGSNSAQMRYYSNKDDRGYVQSTTAVEGLSNVAFKARVSSLDMKLTVSYSADGSAWTALATNVAFEAAGSSGVKTLNYDIPSGGKYIKFEVAEGATKPSSGNIKLIIDDVVFTYAEQEGGGETPATTRTIYCSPFSEWHNDGARFAVYALGDGENTAWYDLVAVEGAENVYSAEIAEAFPTVIFCRMNGATTENNWDNKWNQTADLTLPTDGKNLYTITGWGETDGAWSVYGDTPEPPVEPTLANGFYLIGQNGWDVAALSADLLFAANPEAEGEYVLNTTLAEGQKIKVVKVEDDTIVAWYPDGMDNEYTVDAAHAGEKDIYFQETYKQDWAAFGGFFWTGTNEEPQVEKYCEKPSGHLKDPNFGDPSGRILLTIAKGEGNNIVVKIKNNNEAGNPKTGLNFLRVNAEGATGGEVRYGDGTHAEADVEEVSVIVPFEAARESYNFINIHWAYSGWEGEWAIDGLTVTAAELCDGDTPEPPVEPTLANGFYLIGQNGWDVAALSADLLFAANPEAEGEYVLNTTLAEGQKIKVVKVEDDTIVAWYPDGMDNEYTVDAAHAGEKDIYFQETYKEDWATFGGYFWMGSNEPTAISNTAADAEAVKVLNNGMLLIRKGNKTYNVMGQAVK